MRLDNNGLKSRRIKYYSIFKEWLTLIGEWASYRKAGTEGERGGGGDVRGQGEVCHLRLQGQDGGDGQRTGKKIIFIIF